MDFSFLPEHTQAILFQVLSVLTLAMPLIEKVVAATTTKVDDQVLSVVEKILAVVPRVRLGGK
jgi:hypothetical protein